MLFLSRFSAQLVSSRVASSSGSVVFLFLRRIRSRSHRGCLPFTCARTPVLLPFGGFCRYGRCERPCACRVSQVNLEMGFLGQPERWSLSLPVLEDLTVVWIGICC